MTIRAGEPAPDFTLTTHEGRQLALKSLRGRKVLLWFFVEANTPGCALEGRGFRDHQAYFDENNIAVVGVASIRQSKTPRSRASTSSDSRCSATAPARLRSHLVHARTRARNIRNG